MKIKLSNIADIHTGFYLKSVPGADVLYLQVCDFDACGHYKNNSVPLLRTDSIKPKNLLREGDLLFAAKGATNFCSFYDSSVMGKAVASSSFLVISPFNGVEVLPEYVMWFLNRFDILKRLQSQATCGTILSISKAQLEDLDIVVPSLTLQRKILLIDDLQRTCDFLYSQIARKKQLLTSLLLNQAINNK